MIIFLYPYICDLMQGSVCVCVCVCVLGMHVKELMKERLDENPQ